MKCLAHVEAVIDFGEDEDDCNDEVYDKAGERIANLVKEIKEHLDDGRRGELIRDGLRVALIGPPNAGKSSLLNILARRPAAIVSSIPGTTRDVIEVHMDIAGYPVHVNDTAGLRDTADIIEQEGVKRATEVAGKSQVKVLVVGAHSAFKDRHLESALPNSMLVLNKADKLVDVPAPGPLSVQGVSDFLSGLEEEIRTRYGAMDAESNSTLITRERHRQHVEECLRCLEGFLAQPATVDLAAEELRRAMTSLGRITGRVDVEDLLDIIFTDFCIGK
ncbi:mnmE [Symbiodinium sp. KB8]|nr:mnmE [Symbiodinium sp. KB8]